MNFLDCIRQSKLDRRIFNERQLGDIVGGSDARRYGLVNRALKEQKLLRLKRGLYAVAPKFRPTPLHPYAIAQALLPGSYISFETALAFHGWTPEAVHTTASVTPERKSSTIEIGAIGRYTFSPLAINDYQFLVGVQRKKLGDLTAFIASPLRALMEHLHTWAPSVVSASGAPTGKFQQQVFCFRF